jgi:hypothetical protein
MNEIQQKIAISKYYQEKLDEFRAAEDKIFNNSEAALESVLQRATSLDVIGLYLTERGYDGFEISKIFYENGEKSVSGFKQMIYFLETKFEEAQMKQLVKQAQLEIDLAEANRHLINVLEFIDCQFLDKDDKVTVIKASDFCRNLKL